MKRDIRNATLLGVCSGLARGMGIDALWLRLGFLVLFLHFGVGLLAYLILALLMPRDDGPNPV